MNSKTPQKSTFFSGQTAPTYDQRILKLVPGYQSLHQISAALLGAYLKEQASLLIVGAGTGHELCHLARHHPDWHFTALDCSADMLAIARQKAEKDNLLNQIDFHHVSILDYLTQQNHDAALSLLVGHFFEDSGQRQKYIQAIADNLKSGGLYLFADLSSWSPQTQWDAYRQWASENGSMPAEIDAMCQRLKDNFHPITDDRLQHLMQQAEFSVPHLYFQALDYRGYYSFKK